MTKKPIRITWSLGLLLAMLGSAGFAQKTTVEDLTNNLWFKVSFQSLDDDEAHFTRILGDVFGLPGADIVSIDHPDLGFKITDGLRYSKYFSGEGSLVYVGETEVRVEAGGNAYLLRAEQYGIEIQVVGRYPLLTWLDGFAKGGVFLWRSEMEVERGGAELDPSREEDGASLALSIGVRAVVGKNLAASLSYQRTQLDDLDLGALDLGLGFRF